MSVMVDKVIVLSDPFVSCLESGTVFLLSFTYVCFFGIPFPYCALILEFLQK